MPGSVIVGGARTPIGKLSGALKGFSAMDLGGIAIKEAMARAGVTGEQVDYVIMGHVVQAGAGQITARQAAVTGGIPMSVPALTVNKVCLSGLNAIAMADQLIGYGEFDVVVAGGMESMTNGPYLQPGARSGYRYGDATLIDATAHDALFCAFDLRGMGASTDYYNKAKNITAPSRTNTRPPRTSGPPRPGRTGCSTTRSSTSRSRSAAATPCWSPRTRASVPAPRRRAWPSCARRSRRTGP